ncbi:FUSC family protein [Streptomyces mutabilis]|uniref:FUSC family protein n=1 Tax=Streptomyces mutabilis TaxID=67332 RepID=UPI00365B8B9A
MVTAAVTARVRRWIGAPPALDRSRAARSAVAFGLCFGVVTAVAGVHAGVFAALGCYIDAYGARDPYRRRGPLLALLSLGFLLAIVAGSLAAGNVWAMTAVLAVVAFTATLLVRTLRLSGPGSYFVVLVTAMAAFLPPVSIADTVVRAGYFAIGVAVSWLSAMAGRLVRPYAPEERSVAAALRSAAAFAAAAGRDAAGSPTSGVHAVRRRAYTAAHGAWEALDDARGRRGAPAPRLLVLYALMMRLEGMLDAVQDAVPDTVQDAVQDAAERGGPVPAGWAPWLRDAAVAVQAGRTPASPPVTAEASGSAPPRGAPDPGASAEAGLRAAGAALWPVPLPARKRRRDVVRLVLSSASPAPTIALRVGLSVAVGTVLGWVLPLMHPAWVAVGAAAALQGGQGLQPSQRVGARFVGTVGGVVVTVLVAQVYRPGVWPTVAVATVVHGVSRGLPPSAVRARTLLNTPVALLLVDAAYVSGPGLGPLAAYRLLDLTLGLCLGMAAVLLVPGVPPRRVRAAVSAAVAATGPAVQERLRTGAVDPPTEGAAWQRTAELWTMHASLPDLEARVTGTAERIWPVLLAVRRLLCWNVLAAPAAPAPDDARRVGGFLDVLADAATAGPPGVAGPRPALPPAPRTPEPARAPDLHRRLTALRSALEDPAPASRGAGPPRAAG